MLLCLALLGAILAIVGTSPDPEQAGQVPQLDKSKDCVAVLGMFGAKAEQVTGTVLDCAWLCWVPFWQLWENHLLLIRLDGLVQGDICSQSKQPQSIMTGWGGSTKLITFRDHIYPCIHSL